MIDGEYKLTEEHKSLGMNKTIIHELLESDLPPEEKAHGRVWQDAQILIGAGTETTANTLCTTHFHLLDNPPILSKLQQELRAAMPDKTEPAKLSVVEQLPYLVSYSTCLTDRMLD